MDGDDQRKIIDAYLQGAHLALFALQGKLKGKKAVPPEDLEAMLAELHELFAEARRTLKAEPMTLPPLRGIVPFPVGRN